MPASKTESEHSTAAPLQERVPLQDVTYPPVFVTTADGTGEPAWARGAPSPRRSNNKTSQVKSHENKGSHRTASARVVSTECQAGISPAAVTRLYAKNAQQPSTLHCPFLFLPRQSKALAQFGRYPGLV